jgi:cytidylate kinase
MMGLTSSGKSFQAELIANKLNLKHICGSSLLLEKLNQDDSSKEHWWFTEKGVHIDAQRDKSKIDEDIDNTLLGIAEKQDNFIMESWTVPFLYQGNDAIKIYLNPPAESRIKMALASKEDKSLKDTEILKGINNKDLTSMKRFKELYDIDIFSTNGFDIIMDNSLLKPSQTHEILISFINQVKK